MSRLGLLLLLATVPVTIYATQSSTVGAGAEKFDMDACIKQNIHDCIEAGCMNPSAADCAKQCQKDAETKCLELSKQQL